jgi:hypothetical protein
MAHPDIVLSLEVGEHIPENEAHRYTHFIMERSPDLIYFSAARPGQGGNGHINLQNKAYWIEKFFNKGYWLDIDATEEWITWLQMGPHMGWLRQNGVIFRRGSVD